MPLNLEAIESPSAQDLKELVAIYLDAPDDLLHCKNSDGENSIRAIIEGWLQEPDTTIYAARFKEGLLAAIVVQQVDRSFYGRNLCVLKRARKKGIGIRLLSATSDCIRRQFPECELAAEIPPNSITYHTLVEHLSMSVLQQGS